MDVCYQDMPVIMIGVGGGLSYAALGATHHSCEDIAFLRVIPNMQVICPGDPVEVRLALREAIRLSKPTYIRLGKKGEPVIHQEPPSFQIGKSITISEGKDICLLSTGNILPVSVETSKQLRASGISIQLESFHTVKPLDQELLHNIFARFDLVVTVEEHSILGGLGGSVAEWLSEHSSQKAKLLRFGTPDTFLSQVGSQTYVRQHFGLTPENICRQIISKLK